LKAWASRELVEISTLAGEELWTRFFALIRNCAGVIDSGDWKTFLDTVEARHAGNAILLGLALLAPGKTRQGDKLEKLTPVPRSAFGMPASGALMTLIEGAGKEAWMGKAAGAVIAGRWHQEVDHGKKWPGNAAELRFFDGMAVLALLCSELPLANQVDVLPSLECRDNDDGHSLGIYAELSKRHMLKVGQHVFRNSPDFIFANASPSYFACLAGMYKPAFSHDKMAYARRAMKEIFTHSLENGMKIGPWREQMPELALCLFLTLQCNSKGSDRDDDLEHRLVYRKFMTKHEYADLSAYVARRKNSTFNMVEEWLTMSRGKTVQAQAKPSCIIS
jgi:hypothetical protein